eukprot:GHVU01173714.1.p1 GENE.GHVU01173714.1~~GHVU01173714.1.p1  ORF type:complete len:183 (-),score=33.00 GHVU01173714.1:184-732(-)
MCACARGRHVSVCGAATTAVCLSLSSLLCHHSSAPTHPPLSVEFADTDHRGGQVAGVVTVVSAHPSEVGDVTTGFSLYWGFEDGSPMAELGTLYKNAEDTVATFTVESGTMVARGARGGGANAESREKEKASTIIAYSFNDYGAMAEANVTIPFSDYSGADACVYVCASMYSCMYECADSST